MRTVLALSTSPLPAPVENPASKKYTYLYLALLKLFREFLTEKEPHIPWPPSIENRDLLRDLQESRH